MGFCLSIIKRKKFNENCSKQDSVSFLQKYVLNLYITYEIDTLARGLNTDFILGYSLFGAVKLTKNADPNKYGSSGYDVGFDASSQFSWSEGS